MARGTRPPGTTTNNRPGPRERRSDKRSDTPVSGWAARTFILPVLRLFETIFWVGTALVVIAVLALPITREPYDGLLGLAEKVAPNWQPLVLAYALGAILAVIGIVRRRR